jgi:hypothetical protein
MKHLVLDAVTELKERKIPFKLICQDSGHIEVYGHKKGTIDYYPKADKWQIRGGKSGKTFTKLLGVLRYPKLNIKG